MDKKILYMKINYLIKKFTIIILILFIFLSINFVNADEFSFAVFGDLQASECDDNEYVIRQINSMAESNADFFIHTGDLIAGYNQASCFESNGICTEDGKTGSMKHNLYPLLSKTPPSGLDTAYFQVIGNHDDNWGSNWYPDECGDGICDLIDPDMFINHEYDHGDPCSKIESNSGHPYDMYYSFDYQNSHFIILVINYDDYDFFDSDHQYQYDWLVSDLQDTSNDRSIEHIFLFMHAPVYTSSWEHDPPPAAEQIKELCDEYGIDIFFNGHNHAYERTVPIKDAEENEEGTVYITVGPAGAKTDGISSNQWITAASYRDWTSYGNQEEMSGYMLITVNDNGRIDGQRLGIDNDEQDSFSINHELSCDEIMIHVASNGDDEIGDGSSCNPYKTIQKGVDSQSAEKNELLIHEGIYYPIETIKILEKSGTEENLFIIRGDDAIVDGSNIPITNNRKEDSVFLIELSDYVRIEDLEIRNGKWHCVMISWSDYNEVINNDIHDCRVLGISGGYSASILIEGNKVYNTDESHCVYLANSADHPRVYDNEIYNCKTACFQNNADPRLRYCEEYMGYDWGDPICDGITTDLIFANNILHDCQGGSAVNLASVRDSIFYNNLIYNAKSGGITGWDDWHSDDPDTYPDYQINAYGCRNNKFINNIVYQRSTDERSGISFKRGSTGNIIFNNIIVGGIRRSILIDDSSQNQGFIDYNIYYRHDNENIAQLDWVDSYGQDISEEYFTLNEWQTKYDFDRHTKVINPIEIFEDISSEDFHPKSDSLAIDTGTNYLNLAPDQDLDLISRPKNNMFDIGCYEFDSLQNTIKCTDADTNINGDISNSELKEYIERWLDSEVSLVDLFNVIDKWKNNC